jgi:hypothetical protein
MDIINKKINESLFVPLMEIFSQMRYNNGVEYFGNQKNREGKMEEKVTIDEALELFLSLSEDEKTQVIKFMEEIDR